MNEMVQMNKARDLLALWVHKINLSSAIDFYDINKVSENLCANLLNEIYGYLLINLNPEKRNFPAVDLGCDVKKIAFQITATKEADKVKEKIESTLEKFVNHNLQSRFTDGVRFLFLTTDKLVKLTDANKKKYQGIYSGFDEKHLLTLQDLTQEIQVLYNKDNERFCRVLKILERELSPQSAENITEIVKILTDKHQQESQAKDEQIKALTHAITALSQGQGVIGTEAQINSAFAALKRGDVTEAKSLFGKVAEKSESVIQLESQRAAEAYRNLGALAFLDNTQEALNAYRRATELDPDNADGWNQLGQLFQRVGKLDQAIAAYQTVLKLGQAHQNQEYIAIAYGSLGDVYKTHGNLNKAVEMYNKALAIDEALGNKQGIAVDYSSLGLVYQTRGELDKAVEMHSKALAINQALDSKEHMAENYSSLGSVSYIRGDLDKTIEMYQKSLAINQALSVKLAMAGNYGNLGLVYDIRGDLDKAVEMHNKALAINQALGSKEGMAANYANLGLVYQTRGDLDKTVEMYQKSLAITESLGNKEKMAVVYGNLGIVYDIRGDLDKAIEMHTKALAINQALDSKEHMAENYGNLGAVYELKGSQAKAHRYWRKAIDLYHYLGSPNEKLVQGWLDNLK